MTTNFSRIFLGTILSSFLLTPVAAPAAGTVFSCAPGSVKGMISVAAAATPSTSFVNIPEASVDFTQGGATASCVIARFSAESLSGGGAGDILFVRALLDSSVSLQPFVRYSAVENVYRAHTFEFVFPNVMPGAHTVRMQFRSSSGSSVSVGMHTLIVDYK